MIKEDIFIDTFDILIHMTSTPFGVDKPLKIKSTFIQ